MMFLPSGMTGVPAASPALKPVQGALTCVQASVTGNANVGWMHVLLVPEHVPGLSVAFAGASVVVSFIEIVSVPLGLGLLRRAQKLIPENAVALRHALSHSPMPPP